jgi:hypothetical protein
MSQQFIQEFIWPFTVMPVKTGIQQGVYHTPLQKFLDSGSRQLSPACPETAEFFKELRDRTRVNQNREPQPCALRNNLKTEN